MNFTALDGKGGHACQLHQDEHELVDGLARYVRGGLEKGMAVVVVASAERRENLQSRLAAYASKPDSRSHAVQLIDSAALLGEFMRDGWPDRALFFRALRPVMESAAELGNGSVRVYGEMVNDLWHDGNPAAAARLEQYWNELQQERAFSLFCGYVLDAFDADSYNPYLKDVCMTHSAVMTTPGEEHLRMAIDEACQKVLGIQLSSLLRHSQVANDKWHMRLPLSRRTILWLMGNTETRLTRVLRMARESYLDHSGSAEPHAAINSPSRRS